MSTKNDLTGQRFGNWTVLDDDGTRTSRGKIKWRCVNSAGEIRYMRAFDLRRHANIQAESKPKVDLSGVRSGTWLVLMDSGERSKSGEILWKCLCMCGRLGLRRSQQLRNNPTCNSCLSRSRTIHGYSGSPEYRRWRSMKERCNSPNNKGYKNYGGRGIKVFPEWDTAEGFPKYMKYLDDNLGPCPEGCSLDRIDNDGNYEPGNLRWATASQQNNNRRDSKANKQKYEDKDYGCQKTTNTS